MAKLSSVLQDVIAPIVEALGYEFWGGHCIGQGSRMLLRVYIDSKNGIKIEDCEKVSRQLTAVLDVEEVIPHQYTLEVSSPGLDRALFTLAQFERFVGYKVRLRLYMPLNGQSRFVAKIAGVSGEKIILNIDDAEIELAFSEIERANLII